MEHSSDIFLPRSRTCIGFRWVEGTSPVPAVGCPRARNPEAMGSRRSSRAPSILTSPLPTRNPATAITTGMSRQCRVSVSSAEGQNGHLSSLRHLDGVLRPRSLSPAAGPSQVGDNSSDSDQSGLNDLRRSLGPASFGTLANRLAVRSGRQAGESSQAPGGSMSSMEMSCSTAMARNPQTALSRS